MVATGKSHGGGKPRVIGHRSQQLANLPTVASFGGEALAKTPGRSGPTCNRVGADGAERYLRSDSVTPGNWQIPRPKLLPRLAIPRQTALRASRPIHNFVRFSAKDLWYEGRPGAKLT